ncbi:MAG TPA: hypothetical protein ENI23_07355 [bacterium]|nr:hypothetical protein [bacterium]
MHLPGSWKFEGGEWIIGLNGQRIAQVQNYTPNYLDNGELMAAAPDLLKALKQAKSAVEWMAEATDSDPEDQELLELVNETIGKAEKKQ